MSTVVVLRGSGWKWKPTWRWDLSDERQPQKVWSGNEILLDADGDILRRDDSGRIGQGVDFSALIQRQAPTPDGPMPADDEMAANRARRGLPDLKGGEA